MDDRLSPSQNEMIEEALRSYPVPSMPRDVTTEVLARIRSRPAPRFQFTRNDYLLMAVLTAVFSSILFSLQFLPGHVLIQLRIQIILAWQSFLVNARWLAPALFFGLAAVLAGMAIPSLYAMAMKSKSR